MPFDHLKNESRAIEYLAKNLGDGTLVLILGAGVSASTDLPRWPELINRMEARAGRAASDLASASAEVLQGLADAILRDFCTGKEDQFARLVRDCLYEGVSLSGRRMRSELLSAIGAMMMGSKRGSVSRVVTFNFDSTLEWYMSVHGFVSRIVLQPPELEGSEDVRIYHPHGFLPHPDQRMRMSEFVILGRKAADLRIGKPGDPWFELLRHLLRTGTGLFIGMSPKSFADRAISPLLATVGQELENDRPTAFWMLQRDEAIAHETEFLNYNVVPMSFDAYEDVPEKLLAVCQKAALDWPRSV